MNLRIVHRVLGCAVALFILLHLVNHTALFLGAEQHLRVQDVLRPIYRNPVVEPLLLIAFAGQIFIGARLLFRRGWPKGNWPRIQAVSGAFLALFLIQHVSAALLTRALKPAIDTNIYWAAAVVSRIEFALYFAPYYVLGILALFLHLAAFLAVRYRTASVAVAVIIAGGAYAVSMVAVLAGGLFQIDLPPPYHAYLDDFWF